jgi:hypothetical protein
MVLRQPLGNRSRLGSDLPSVKARRQVLLKRPIQLLLLLQVLALHLPAVWFLSLLPALHPASALPPPSPEGLKRQPWLLPARALRMLPARPSRYPPALRPASVLPPPSGKESGRRTVLQLA